MFNFICCNAPVHLEWLVEIWSHECRYCCNFRFTIQSMMPTKYPKPAAGIWSSSTYHEFTRAALQGREEEVYLTLSDTMRGFGHNVKLDVFNILNYAQVTCWISPFPWLRGTAFGPLWLKCESPLRALFCIRMRKTWIKREISFQGLEPSRSTCSWLHRKLARLWKPGISSSIPAFFTSSPASTDISSKRL